MLKSCDFGHVFSTWKNSSGFGHVFSTWNSSRGFGHVRNSRVFQVIFTNFAYWVRSWIKEKIGTNASKWSNDRFLWKSWPTLGQIISRTKCDRDKPIFFLQKERVNKIELGIKSDNGIGKCQKRGSIIERKFPTMFKYGSAMFLDSNHEHWLKT